MNHVAQICQQLVIVFLSKILPTELRITRLRSIHYQVVPPDLTRNIFFKFNRIVTENSSSMSLTELSSLIVQVLSRWYMMKKSPVFLTGNQRWRKDDCMKRNIVLTHKLIQLYIFVFPPVNIVLLQKLCSDRYISNWCIEPHIKYLIFELLDRNRNSPFQISSDTFVLQTHVYPSICDICWIRTPNFACTFDPSLQLLYYLR